MSVACLCVLGIRVMSCAKTDDPIDMPFGGQTVVDPCSDSPLFSFGRIFVERLEIADCIVLCCICRHLLCSSDLCSCDLCCLNTRIVTI